MSDHQDQDKIDWNSGSHSGLVSIGTHSLLLNTSGPSRWNPTTPVVIIEAGVGDNHTSWAAVVRLISPFVRVYSYDRAGLGRSEDSPSNRTAETIANELSLLLKAAAINPPYIFVAHSYGGIIAREFLALRGDDVVGLVLVDASHEETEIGGHPIRIPPAEKRAVMGGLDYVAVIGLEFSHKYTPQEWEAFVNAESGTKDGLMRELAAMDDSHLLLKSKMQLRKQVLGDRPLVVVKGHRDRDFRKLYEAGVSKGNGTSEQRLIVKEGIDRMEDLDTMLAKDQMRLSRRSRYVIAEESGHEIQATQPELIVEEIRWILELL